MLGAIVEQVSGQTYSDYLDAHIFQPAGMTDSGLNVSGEKIEHLATAYNGNIANGDEAKVLHPSFGYSSGGLHSTAMDLYKYDRALRENTLISGESYRLMTQAYSTIGTRWPMIPRSLRPGLTQLLGQPPTAILNLRGSVTQ